MEQDQQRHPGVLAPHCSPKISVQEQSAMHSQAWGTHPGVPLWEPHTSGEPSPLRTLPYHSLEKPCPICRLAWLHQQFLYIFCTIPRSYSDHLNRSRPSQLSCYNGSCSYWVSLGLFCTLAFLPLSSSETPAQDTALQPQSALGTGAAASSQVPGCPLPALVSLSPHCGQFLINQQ